jgi:hypothetical protein
MQKAIKIFDCLHEFFGLRMQVAIGSQESEHAPCNGGHAMYACIDPVHDLGRSLIRKVPMNALTYTSNHLMLCPYPFFNLDSIDTRTVISSGTGTNHACLQ